jgi:hypothetical protein
LKNRQKPEEFLSAKAKKEGGMIRDDSPYSGFKVLYIEIESTTAVAELGPKVRRGIKPSTRIKSWQPVALYEISPHLRFP